MARTPRRDKGCALLALAPFVAVAAFYAFVVLNAPAVEWAQLF